MSKNGWLLLADSRRRFWRSWLYGSTPLLLLTFVQTITPRFEGMEKDAWWWVCINLLPAFTLLFVSMIRYGLPQKLIPASVHKSMWAVTLGYLLLLYVTILSEVEVLNRGGALQAYYRLSYTWLVPFQAVLLAGYYLVFFSKVRIARPDNRNILELAAEKSREPNRSDESKACFERIAAADLAGAFRLAQSFAHHLDDQQRDDLAMLSGSFAEIRQKMAGEEISAAEVQMQVNRITIGLMNLVATS